MMTWRIDCGTNLYKEPFIGYCLTRRLFLSNMTKKPGYSHGGPSATAICFFRSTLMNLSRVGS